ncbi:MAG: peptidase M14 [Planctomycetes bacterium]|nr:peptidase M14 [Planctomycetota bacterium]
MLGAGLWIGRWIAAVAAASAATAPVSIDSAFPGGNIIVDRIDGDDIFIRQDLRDTEGDWFHWAFRVRGSAGRTLTFHFTKGDVIGVRGPAVSEDGGETWRWLGRAGGADPAFRFTFPAGAGEVRFAFAVPYLERDLRAFLRRHESSLHLRVETLCATAKGRPVERLHAGRIDGRPAHRVLVACRHHACESMASYALEGLLETVLADPQDGAWLRERVEILAIPFVDKDGVEDGDQGKNRRPHDHNRDYAGDSIHASVRAIRDLAPRWSEGRLRVALDLHCPYIRGIHNEWIYFVGGPDAANWARVGRLASILEAIREGPLPYRAGDNLAFGEAWNTNDGPLKSFARWAADLPGIRVASTIEIPYANARGAEVSPSSARAFGRDLARALRRFLDAPDLPDEGGAGGR